MIAARFGFALLVALLSLSAVSFSGCAGPPAPALSNDPNQCAIYFCETFDHDLVTAFTGHSQVFSERITTNSDSNLARTTTVSTKGTPFVLRLEVPARHARLVQTIDPKRGRYLMVSMDRSYQLSLTQRVDQPAID